MEEDDVSVVPANNGLDTTPSVIPRRTKIIILVLLSIVYFLITSVFALLAPFFPHVAKDRNVQNFETGLIFAMYPFFIFLFAPIVGILMPRVGVLFSLWAGIVFESGCNIIFGFLPNIIDHGTFVAFCIFMRAMQGIGAAFSQTAALALISSVFPDSVATSTSLLEISAGLGLMAGPPIGGLLYQAGGFALPFIVLGSTMMVLGCIVVYFITRLPNKSRTPPIQLMKQLLRLPRVIIICLGAIIQMLAFGFLDPTLAPHLKPLHLTPPQLGLVFLTIAAGYGFFAPLFGYLSDRFGFRPFIIFGLTGMAASLLFLGPAPFINIPLSLGQTIPSLIGLGVAASAAGVPLYADMLDAAVTELGSKDNDNDATSGDASNKKDDFAIYSVASGLFGACFSLGQVFGPIVGGSFTTSSKVSFKWLCTGVAIAVTGEAILILLLTIWERFYKTAPRATSTKESKDNEPGETSPLLH